ncbi:MAG TPA: hypothetical protein VKQ36_14330 [Ktedonobacterales bacterium]|nr:hypothetical protein [Ktedonobacterales bacterium]
MSNSSNSPDTGNTGNMGQSDVSEETTAPLPGNAAPPSAGVAAPARPLASGQPATPSGVVLPSGPRARRTLWHVAQGLITAGAALFAYAAWATWAQAISSASVKVSDGVTTLCGPHDTGCTVRTVLVYLNPGEIGAPPLLNLWGAPGAFFAWSVLTVVGLLLCPFIWQASRPWLSRSALAVYTLWALVMTVVTAATARILSQNFASLVQQGNTQRLYVYAYNQAIPITNAQPAFGLTLAIVALGLAFVGVALSLVMTLAGGAPASTASITASLPVGGASGDGDTGTTGAARAVLPGAGAVTLGVVLWFWGFFSLPWATQGCDTTPLFLGECQGIPVSTALQFGIHGAGVALDPYIGGSNSEANVGTIETLLLVGAILILGTLWRRAINRTLCVWASLWVVVAFISALVATQGASLGVDNPARYGLSGVWRGDSGVLLSFLGLLLVLVGLVPLWAVAIRRSRLIAASEPDT